MRITVVVMIALSLFILLPGVVVQGLEYKSGEILVSDKEAPGYRIKIIRGNEINERRDLYGNILNWICLSDSDSVHVLIVLKSARHIWLRHIVVPSTGLIIDMNVSLFDTTEIIRSATATISQASKTSISVTLELDGEPIPYQYDYIHYTLTRGNKTELNKSSSKEIPINILLKETSILIILASVTAILILVAYSFILKREILFFASSVLTIIFNFIVLPYLSNLLYSINIYPFLISITIGCIQGVSLCGIQELRCRISNKITRLKNVR